MNDNPGEKNPMNDKLEGIAKNLLALSFAEMVEFSKGLIQYSSTYGIAQMDELKLAQHINEWATSYPSKDKKNVNG